MQDNHPVGILRMEHQEEYEAHQKAKLRKGIWNKPYEKKFFNTQGTRDLRDHINLTGNPEYSR